MSLRSELKSILKHTSIYGITRILSRSAGFIMIPIYTRCLTPSDYGTVELLDLLLNLIGLMTATSISNAVFKYYYAYDADADRKAVVSTAIISTSAIALLISLSASFFAGPIAGALFGKPEFKTYVLIAFSTFALDVTGMVPQGYLRAQQRSMLFSVLSLARLVLSLGMNIVFIVVLRMGVLGVLLALLISTAIFSLALLVMTLRETGIHFRMRNFREIYAFGLPLAPSYLGLFIINYGDRFWIKHFGDLRDVGVYALGWKFGYMVSYLVFQPFRLIWDAKLYELGKTEEGPAYFSKIFTAIAFFLVICSLGMALFIGPVIRIMAAPEFWGAARVVPLIVLAYLFEACSYFFRGGLFLKGKTKTVGMIELSAGLLALGGYYVLVGKYLSMGAASATMIAFCMMAAFNYIASQRVYPVPYEFGKAGALLALGIALYLLRGLIPMENPFADLAVSAGFLAAFPALLLLSPFFSAQEKESLLAMASSLRKKG